MIHRRSPDESWRRYEGMIVLKFSLIIDNPEISNHFSYFNVLKPNGMTNKIEYPPGPRGGLDMNLSFSHPAVSVEEVLHQKQGELFWTSDTVILCQNVNRIFLAIRGDDVRVVALNMLN